MQEVKRSEVHCLTQVCQCTSYAVTYDKALLVGN